MRRCWLLVVSVVTFGLLLSACWLVRGPGSPGAVRTATISTIYGEAADGRVTGVSVLYSTARGTSTACATSDKTRALGQQFSTPNYSVWRGFLSFDTSSLAGGTVATATLCMAAQTDSSTTDFQMYVYRYAWSEPLCTDDEGNYDGAYGGSATRDGTLFDTSGGIVSGTYYCTGVSAGGINTAGDTKYSLASGRDVTGTAPTGNEYVTMYMSEWTAAPPYLSINWTVGTATPTKTATNTPTETPTNTPTVGPTPTVTPICPVLINSDTTWGPGTVRVNCNVGITSGVTLSLAAGTEVRFVGETTVDVAGKLYAVGSAAEPITLSHETGVITGSWGYVYLRGQPSVLDYVNVYCGHGVNDVAGSAFTHSNFMTNTIGLVLRGPAVATVVSCTLQYNGVGVLAYGYSVPVMCASNVLSNTVWDVQMGQTDSVTASGCWWGNVTPPATTIWDYDDDFRLGMVSQDAPAGAWVAW